MVESGNQTAGRQKGKLEAAGIKRIVQLIVFGLVFGAVLFLSAGRLDWLEGWLFAGAFMAYLVIMSVWGIRRDSELLNERGTRKGGKRPWFCSSRSCSSP